MIVQDLLKTCDRKILMNKIIDIYNSHGRAHPLDIDKISKAHDVIFDNLLSMNPLKMNEQWVILGVIIEQDACLSLWAELYPIDRPDGIKAKLNSLLSDLEIESISNDVLRNKTLTNDELKGYLDNSHKTLPQAYSYTMTPWNEIISYQVDPNNVFEVGSEDLMSKIIYEMTFYGFDEDTIAQERKKLDDAIAELEEIKTLPPNEQSKHFKNADDFFKEIGFHDNRTEKEKEQDLQNMRWESLHNILNIRKTILQTSFANTSVTTAQA